MNKLPQEQLNELVNIAETELRIAGNLTTATNKIENIAYNRGFKVDRKEVKAELVAKLALEVSKEITK